MQWFYHPAFQSALAPFTLALLLLTPLIRHRRWAEPLALLCCFLFTTYLITGLSLQPLTSTRKLMLILILCFALGHGLAYFPGFRQKNTMIVIVALASFAAVTWINWSVLNREELLYALISVPAFTLYCVSNFRALHRIESARLKFFGICAIFSMVIALVSIIGASALVGQLSMSLAMVCVAVFLLQWIKPINVPNMTPFLLTLSLPVSLLSMISYVYASVPWFTLLAIALIPLSTYVKLPGSLNKRYTLLAELLVAVIPGLLALLLTWNSAGPVPF